MQLSRRSLAATLGVFSLLVLTGIWFTVWRARRMQATPDALLQRLPTREAAVAAIDFEALRRGKYLSVLAGTKAQEEPEYTAFVRDTGFDYQRDLQYVIASFAPDGEFFLVRGAFDWKRIEQYALRSKGSCHDHLCQMPGSAPDRKISFFPLQQDVLAMAVSSDGMSVARLENLGPQADIEIPDAPVWLSMSTGALRHAAALAGSTKLLTSAVADARRLTLTLQTSGHDLEARLEALCNNGEQAAILAGQLRALTNMLQKGATKQPGASATRNLTGVLLAGTFDQAGSRVLGRWPISRDLLENLAGRM